MALKVAMHNWMRPEPIEVTIERLAKAGYDAIEIGGEPATTDVDEVRRLLDQHSLRLWGAVTLMVGGRDLLHEDAYVRRGSIEYVKDTIDLVAALGGEILTVVPSTVGKIVPMGSPEDEWDWAVASLKECQAHAEEKGVRLALEPLNRFETYFLNRHDQALALAEDVGGNCGVCLDIFHMNIEEADWAEAIRTVAGEGKLYAVHVADNNRMPCGQGAIDWGAFVGTLEEAGYDEYLTVEFVVTVDRSRISTRKEIGDASEAEASVGLEQFLRDHGTGAVPDQLYDQYVRESIEELRRHIGARTGAPA
jgi:D-psicose/D-tagatose/L-ribulose 3-epimerase